MKDESFVILVREVSDRGRAVAGFSDSAQVDTEGDSNYRSTE